MRAPKHRTTRPADPSTAASRPAATASLPNSTSAGLAQAGVTDEEHGQTASAPGNGVSSAERLAKRPTSEVSRAPNVPQHGQPASNPPKIPGGISTNSEHQPEIKKTHSADTQTTGNPNILDWRVLALVGAPLLCILSYILSHTPTSSVLLLLTGAGALWAILSRSRH